MSRKIDEDLKKMAPAQLRKEIMRLRAAFRKELRHTGNHRCWINLLEALPEGGSVRPLSLPRDMFIKNCERYYERNTGKISGAVPSKIRTDNRKIKKLQEKRNRLWKVSLTPLPFE